MVPSAPTVSRPLAQLPNALTILRLIAIPVYAILILNSTDGHSWPAAILFAAAIMFMIAVLLHYSTVLSRLTDDNVVLAQEVALLRARLDALDARGEPD